MFAYASKHYLTDTGMGVLVLDMWYGCTGTGHVVWVYWYWTIGTCGIWVYLVSTTPST